MPPAEVLDAPRILAIASEPPELTPGAAHTLRALVFEVGAELEWSLCPDAWTPSEPLGCASGATVLGRGNPLNVSLPSGLTSAWLQVVPVDGSALPAVKRLEVGSGAVNPVLAGFADANGQAPTTVAAGAKFDVVPTFGDAASLVDPARVVTTWYVTAGTLDPARSVGTKAVTLTAPKASGPLSVIAVARELSGGTDWRELPLEVTP